MKLVSFIKKAFLIPACFVLAVLLAAIVPATVQGCDSVHPIQTGMPDTCSCYTGTKFARAFGSNTDGFPCTVEVCNTYLAKFCLSPAPIYSSDPAPGSIIDVGSASVGVSVSKPLKVSRPLAKLGGPIDFIG